jgi:chromosome segregation ATPase
MAEHRSRAMREGILSNELQDCRSAANHPEPDSWVHWADKELSAPAVAPARERLAGVAKRREGAEVTRRLLLDERRSVQGQVTKLQEQLRLIDQHLEGQEVKRLELDAEEKEAHARIGLLEKTIQGLRAEVDKLEALALGLDDAHTPFDATRQAGGRSSREDEARSEVGRALAATERR